MSNFKQSSFSKVEGSGVRQGFLDLEQGKLPLIITLNQYSLVFLQIINKKSPQTEGPAHFHCPGCERSDLAVHVKYRI